MEFVSKEDIDAPIQNVFDLLSDFDGFERAALRRGAEVQRIDDLEQIGPGMAWDIGFMMRGKPRDLRLTLTEYDPPHGMVFSGGDKGLEGTVSVELVALSRTRTRMALRITLAATNLPARLMLQSLKLGKTKLQSRFHLRMADFATELEERYRRTA
ncbi:MAG: SRPBCC family protein [Thalassovita sp.]|nr:SRPBCC family protein [Thalassovita sp.]